MLRASLVALALLLACLSLAPTASAECIETGPTYGVSPEDCETLAYVDVVVALVNCAIDTAQGQECE